MNKPKFPPLRVPQWPLAASLEAAVGCGVVALNYGSTHPQRSLEIPLRSETEASALYVALRVVVFEDSTCSLEVCMVDVYRASLSEARRVVWLMEQVQRRVDKAWGDRPPYLDLARLADILYEVFRALGVREVIEYRGIGQRDNVRSLGMEDVAKYVSVAHRMVGSLKAKCA